MDLRSGSEYERIAEMRRWPFLVLDEVFAERDTTGFATEHLTTLLCSRVGRWTVITSNLGLAEIQKYDMRLASRMIRGGSMVVEVNTKDFSSR